MAIEQVSTFSASTGRPAGTPERHPFSVLSQRTSPATGEVLFMMQSPRGIAEVPEMVGHIIMAIPPRGTASAIGYEGLEDVVLQELKKKQQPGERPPVVRRSEVKNLLTAAEQAAEQAGTPIRTRMGKPREGIQYGVYFDPLPSTYIDVDRAPGSARVTVQNGNHTRRTEVRTPLRLAILEHLLDHAEEPIGKRDMVKALPRAEGTKPTTTIVDDVIRNLEFGLGPGTLVDVQREGSSTTLQVNALVDHSFTTRFIPEDHFSPSSPEPLPAESPVVVSPPTADQPVPVPEAVVAEAPAPVEPPARRGPLPTAIPRRPIPTPPPLDSPSRRRERTGKTGIRADDKVRFFFPGKKEPTFVEPRYFDALTALSPFTSAAEPPRLVTITDIPNGGSDSFMHDIRRTFLDPYGYRLTRVEAPRKENAHYFVERRLHPTTRATLVGEHLTARTGRLVLLPDEYDLIRRFPRALSVDTVSAGNIANLNNLLALTTGEEEPIKLRTAEDGQQFYDLLEIGITRWKHLDPLLPLHLQGIDAVLDPQGSASFDDFVAKITPEGSRPERNRTVSLLNSLLVRLYARLTLGISTPPEIAVADRLMRNMGVNEISPEELFDQVTFKIQGQHISIDYLSSLMQDIDPAELNRRKRHLDVPIIERPAPAAHLLPAEPSPPGAEEVDYTPEFITTAVAGICDELLALRAFDQFRSRPVGYIERHLEDPDITREGLEGLVENGIVTPARHRGTRGKQSVIRLTPAGTVAAIMHLRHRDMDPELHPLVRKAAETELRKRQPRAVDAYTRHGRFRS